ncbi:hypothetical protein PUNSTDRAFT_42030 [Punctularia strigosozonata HHB-11173 SS5]|uniref:uncharacterized protein n=1 Tax=Punctularia strigosozonata (strain HHB-11173) TaxID=741275 RepID=UPI0004416C4B|nr:uncharacterized protein PUNSTDRAFT_42030 [Punctularia strigosozonata HHB-11173 SS5]EIN12407.1 hypothetical protein PUNSTDRAFT_42030 [Punctularia strigosozonata HHB-11173 SS5]
MSSSVDVPPSRQGQAMDVDGDVLESQGAAGRSMPAAGPSDTSDPAATLRAAALMTLKRGRPRRGSSVVPAPPRRPLPASSRADIIPPDSVQLDYGSDEMIPAVVPVSKPAPASKNDKAAPSDDKSAPKDDKDASEDEEGQIREEGEISDSESTTPQHPSNVKTPAPKSTPAAEMPSPTPQIPSVDKLSLKPHPIRTSPPANPSTGSIAPLVASPISIAPTTRSSSLDTVQPVVDENHVRPGLAMTQVQYSTAQDIILDLLGWGVPPEYLVDYGLSREVIFYVFTDLHLRLPSNLDCTGLAEWHPPNGRLSAPSDMLSTRVPPPLQASRRRSSGHPSLPPKPSVPQGQVVTRTSSSGLSTSAAPFIPNTQPSPNTPLRPSSSLNDMEQQRRQELLARKAALASRKLKAAASLAETSSHSTPSSTASSPRAPPSASDIVMNMAGGAPKLTSVAFGDSFASMSTKAVPEATVEELLRAALVQASGTASDPNVMDVDEPIPGFGQITTASGSGSTSASASRASPPHHTADRAPRPGSKTSGPPPASGSAAAPFRSPPHDADATSANGTPSATSAHAEDDGAAPPPSASSFGSEASTVRRGTKRPVAADFVDFDPGPRARSRSNPHGQPDEVSHGHGQSLARLSRKNGSFAGLTGSRRCVIELSDDEGDDGRGDEGANGHGQRNGHEGGDNDGLARNGRPFWSPAPHIPYASGAATPTTSMSPRMLTQSPAALLEKEQEIKRMREMIAQREMLRKKKLALQAVSGATTGPPTPVSQMPGPTSNGTTFAVTPLARTPEVTAPTTPERKEDSNDDVHHDDPEHVKTELKSPLALKMPIG